MTKDDDPFRSDRGAFFAAMQPFDSPTDDAADDAHQPDPSTPDAPTAIEPPAAEIQPPTPAPEHDATPPPATPPTATPPTATSNRAADFIDALLTDDAAPAEGSELSMAGRRAGGANPADALDTQPMPEHRHEKGDAKEGEGDWPENPEPESEPAPEAEGLPADKEETPEPENIGRRRWRPRATITDIPRAAAHSIRHRPSPASMSKWRKNPLAWSGIAIVACVLVGYLFVTQGSGADTKGVSIASSAPKPTQPDPAAGGGSKPPNGGLEGDEPITVLKAIDRCPSGSTPAIDAFQNKPSGLGWVCIRANNSDGQLLTVTFDKKYVLSAVNVVPGSNIIENGVDQWYKNCLVTRMSVTVKEKGRTADGQPVTGYAEFSTGNRRDTVSMPIAGWVTGEVLIRILETTKVTNPNPPQQDQQGGAGGPGLPGFTFGNEPTGANATPGGGQTEQCPNYSSKDVTRFALGMIQFIGHPAA